MNHSCKLLNNMMLLRTILLLICVNHVVCTLVHPHEDTEQCRQHVDLYKQGLADRQDFALRMYDASTKIPQGVLEGIWVYLGNYDECIGVIAPSLEDKNTPQFTGKYCRVILTNITLPERRTYSDTLDNDLVTNFRQAMELPLRHAILNAMQEHDTKVPGDVMSVIRGVQISVCAPSTCGAEGVAEVTSHNMGLVLGGATVTAVTVPNSCVFRDDPARTLDSADWGFITLMIILSLIIIISTIYEYYTILEGLTPKHKALIAFSLHSNCSQLFTAKRKVSLDTISCLHGLRTFSIIWVVLGHCFANHTYFPVSNPMDAAENFPYVINATFLNSCLAVDTFFLLSGLLLSYKVCCAAHKGSLFSFTQLPKYYIFRYIRLTTPLALFVFFTATLAEFVSNGPLWSMHVISAGKNCQDNWWATLLYVNNYVKNKRICLYQSWYLSVDMQFYILAPLVLLPLVRWPKKTIGLITFMLLASTSAIFALTYIFNLPWTSSSNATDVEIIDQFWNYIYVNTPMRAQPYLCGIVLGYFLSDCDWLKSIKIPRWGVIVGWVLSTCTCLAVVYTLSISYQTYYQYNVLDASFYASLHRLGWALGLCWIIFTCFTDRGGIVNSILSWRLLHPLSKLSYCIFIVHALILSMEGGTWRNHGFFSHFNIIHSFLGDMFIIVPIAIALYLLIEAPTAVLLSCLINNRKSEPDININEKKTED